MMTGFHLRNTSAGVPSFDFRRSDIAGQPIELGDGHRTSLTPRFADDDLAVADDANRIPFTAGQYFVFQG